ncbi:hypothetical protein CERZMDRAFT_92087 [Cercospora zeae-maydis SCOH1-5]|uniref:Uncharacterized protein n=1 Tax=Cercospora zeae-maydis SCOH1-5 TaxID=717836 RepID=A0A6A6FVD5_9PEZI|nr:hypothetical protein CERZMDRAFT_92087 [Cercospora zeae-maydis SCOH1-5]
MSPLAALTCPPQLFCAIGHDGPYKQCTTTLLSCVVSCEQKKGKPPLRYHHTTCFPKEMAVVWGLPPAGKKFYCKVCERVLHITEESAPESELGTGYVLEKGKYRGEWRVKRV